MRIDVHAVGIKLSSALRNYAETRVWMAARRHARRVTWLSVWLAEHNEASEAVKVACRIDGWLRRRGHVSVRHLDSNPFTVVDIAAARFEQAVRRRMKQVAGGHIPGLPNGEPLRRGTRAGIKRRTSAVRRLALVIQRRDDSRRLSLIPLLRAKYGIEELSQVTLPLGVWQGLVHDPSLADSLKDRLALGLLGQPELIVIVGRQGSLSDGETIMGEQEHVHRIVQQIREWSLPVEVIGLWINENWGRESVIESEELRAELPCESAVPDGYHTGQVESCSTRYGEAARVPVPSG